MGSKDLNLLFIQEKNSQYAKISITNFVVKNINNNFSKI